MNIPPKYEDVVAQLALEREQEESTLGELEDLVEKLNNALVEIDALQQRLTSAEQREAELKKLLCDVINEAPTGFSALKVDLANRVNSALKLSADAKSSPPCPNCKVCMGSPDFPENCLINGVKP